ncbi:cytochrome b [Geminicoccus roseus]|uniref:cytochrome b n=1 Tax=Geminicoccus roseus TaxID=404900 RepID=UPI00041A772C|nr:cytochrome b [Geminicoccus roseus]
MAANALEARRQAALAREKIRRYDIVSIVLHWLTVLLVLVQIVAGLVMTDLERGTTQDVLYYTHKSVGIAVLLVVLLRLLWRIGHPWPPLPPDTPSAQAGLARLNHLLLYVMLLVMPISGFVFTAAGGYPVPFFGLVDLTGVIAKNPDLAKTAQWVHLSAQWVVYALVALHVLGALYHLVVRKDGVFQRMWP